MTFFTNTHAGITLADRLTHFWSDLADAQAKNKIYRITKSELQNLSDRELADLNIGRSMIKGIALEAAGYK